MSADGAGNYAEIQATINAVHLLNHLRTIIAVTLGPYCKALYIPKTRNPPPAASDAAKAPEPLLPIAESESERSRPIAGVSELLKQNLIREEEPVATAESSSLAPERESLEGSLVRQRDADGAGLDEEDGEGSGVTETSTMRPWKEAFVIDVQWPQHKISDPRRWRGPTMQVHGRRRS